MMGSVRLWDQVSRQSATFLPLFYPSSTVREFEPMSMRSTPSKRMKLERVALYKSGDFLVDNFVVMEDLMRILGEGMAVSNLYN